MGALGALSTAQRQAVAEARQFLLNYGGIDTSAMTDEEFFEAYKGSHVFKNIGQAVGDVAKGVGTVVSGATGGLFEGLFGIDGQTLLLIALAVGAIFLFKSRG